MPRAPAAGSLGRKEAPAPDGKGAPSIRERLARLDWAALERDLDAWGHARTGPLLTPPECAALRDLFPQDRRFRSRIHMQRYRYGVGDYAYFAHPLPAIVRALRTHAYARLAPIANRWMAALEAAHRYPAALPGFLERCHAGGQTRPTPLLLRYTAGGNNRLHQDRYGPLAFPLQLTAFLSRPGADYGGGAFLLVEQHPRQQSQGDALLPEQGELVLFPSDLRPVQGARGLYRARVRHGVGRVTAGERYTLGVIFHDAE